MGTPMPRNRPGIPCLNCWGPGEEFGDTPTPHVITVQLFDLEPGENWDPDLEQLLLTPHLLTQTNDPCVYNLSDEHFAWTWYFELTVTAVSVKHIATDSDVFLVSTPPKCQLSLPSDLVQPVFNYAYHGTIVATWNPMDLI